MKAASAEIDRILQEAPSTISTPPKFERRASVASSGGGGGDAEGALADAASGIKRKLSATRWGSPVPGANGLINPNITAEQRAVIAAKLASPPLKEVVKAADFAPLDTSLPPDWQKVGEPGNTYYWNTKTSETTWDKPMMPMMPASALVELPPARSVSLADRPDRGAISGSVVAAPVVATATTTKSPVATLKDPEVERKTFKDAVSQSVVKVLGRYRKKDCEVGRITNNDDFKHVARKIAKYICTKELESGQDGATGSAPVFDDATKHKVKNFVKSYMKKTGTVYQRGHR